MLTTCPELTLRQFFEQRFLADNCPAVSTQGRIRATLNRWEKLTNNPPIAEITRDTIIQFRTEILKQGLMKSTTNSNCSAIRILLRDAEHEISWRKVILKETHEMGHVPTATDIDAVYRAAESSIWPLVRPPRFSRREVWCQCGASAWWRCLLVTACTTGFRRADLFALRWDDIDEKTSIIRRIANKTGKVHKIPLLPCLAEHLQPLRKNGTETVFGCSDRLNRVSRELNRLCDAAGVTPFGLQCLRRFAGTIYELAGAPAGRLLLGHDLAHSVSFLHYIDISEVLKRAADSLKLPESFITAN